MRDQFPLLKKTTYLDSGAGALKPIPVIEAIKNFYLETPINLHSIDSALGVEVMKKMSKTRQLAAELINASENEVIFTSGATDGINKLAQMFKVFLKKGDEVILSYYNHTSNTIPWIEIAKEKGAKVIFSKNLFDDINDKTKIVAYAQVNNTVHQFIDIERLHKTVKKAGAVLVNDAAQAIAHEDVSLHEADAIVFSGNKLYGPTGIGVLGIRKELLEVLQPSTFGGGSNSFVEGTKWKAKDGVAGFEPGTLNTAGIIGLGVAIDFFNENANFEYEKELAEYAFDKLNEIDGIKMYSRKGDINILFNIKEYNSQDVVSHLGHKGIILRAGKHCAKNLSEVLDFSSSVRLSIAMYNNEKDIDKTIAAIKAGGDFIDL